MNAATQISDIVRKIQALRARAADSASTEAEAEMAARIAAQLLAKHNISVSEVEVRADGIIRKSWDSGRENQPIEFCAAWGIEKLCNVKIWRSGGRVSILGSPADVEAALYFFDLVRAAITSCWRRFKGNLEYVGLVIAGGKPRAIGISFRKGVAIRLGECLASMKVAEQQAGGDGRGIVLVKEAMIREWLEARNFKAQPDRTSISDRLSLAAGVAAAENVALRRGIRTADPDQLALGAPA